MGIKIFCDICKKDMDSAEDRLQRVFVLGVQYADVCSGCETAIQGFISPLMNTTARVEETKQLTAEISQPEEGAKPGPVEKEKKRGKKKAAEPENASVVGGDGAPGAGENEGTTTVVCFDESSEVPEGTWAELAAGKLDNCEGCGIVDGGCAGEKLCASETSDNWRELAEGGSLVDRSHEECDSCERLNLEPPQCSGHPAGEVACPEFLLETVYCHACSKAGGAERGIYHAPPICPDDDESELVGHVPAPVVSFDEEVPPNMVEEGICEHGKGMLARCDECKRFTHTLSPGHAGEPLPADENPLFFIQDTHDKHRACCMPGDRDIYLVGDDRYTYCRECGLITKKEDTSVVPWVKYDLDPVRFEFINLKLIGGGK